MEKAYAASPVEALLKFSPRRNVNGIPEELNTKTVITIFIAPIWAILHFLPEWKQGYGKCLI